MATSQYTSIAQVIPGPSVQLDVFLTISDYANALEVLTVSEGVYHVIFQQLIVTTDVTHSVHFAWLEVGIDQWDASKATIVSGAIIDSGTTYILVRLNV
jgi:hypothetical protein